MSWQKFKEEMQNVWLPEGLYEFYLQWGNDYRKFCRDDFVRIPPKDFARVLQEQGVVDWRVRQAHHAAELVVRAFHPLSSRGLSLPQKVVKPFRENAFLQKFFANKPISPALEGELEKFYHKMMIRGLKLNTVKAYLRWLEAYLSFSRMNLDTGQIESFLNNITIRKNLSPTTQKQALSSITFYFKQVKNITLENIYFNRSRKQVSIPEILSIHEVSQILDTASGQWKVFLALLYGCGLRVAEALNLRFKDIHLDTNKVHVRMSKGHKSRVISLPTKLLSSLTHQKEYVEFQYKRDLAEQPHVIIVDLPFSLARASPNLAKSLDWQYFFPNEKLMRHPQTDQLVRFHYHPDTVRKRLRATATSAGIKKRVHPHMLRHSFATHSLENGLLIEQLKELMGHTDIRTTMIYLHTSSIHKQTRSPLDDIL